MKKTTVFVLLLVYIASFIIVGLFGISISNYNPKIYVEEIQISVPDQGIEFIDKTKYNDDDSVQYYRFITEYKEDLVFKLKVDVIPSDADHTDIEVIKDETKKFNVEIVDKCYLYVSNFIEDQQISFFVQSTDGMQVKSEVRIWTTHLESYGN